MCDTLDTQRSGNTKSSRSRGYCITINNFTISDTDTFKKLCENAEHWIYGEEVGESGTPHLQGFIYFKNARYFSAIKKVLPNAHIETAKGNIIQNFEYCSKDGKYFCDENFLSYYNKHKPKPLKLLKDEQLVPWQREIVELIHTDPDERSIYWYWEPTGKAGKSTFTKYLVATFDFCTFSTACKSADIATIADPAFTTYVFDFSRSNIDFAPYGALEQLKNGLISDSKLKKKSRNIIMNCPHIICFANSLPNINSMSSDRWKIKEIPPLQVTDPP